MKRGSAKKKSGTKDINRALAKLKALVKVGKLEVIGTQEHASLCAYRESVWGE